MKVGIYSNREQNEPQVEMLEAGIREAVNANTITRISLLPGKNLLRQDDDLRLLYGTLGVCASAMADEVPYIVVDYGYLCPKKRDKGEVEGYYRMTWCDHQFSDVEERRSDRWARLATAMRPWQKHGEHIAMSGISHFEMERLGYQNQEQWMLENVAKIRDHTQRPILYRPKPWPKSNNHHYRRAKKAAAKWGYRYYPPNRPWEKFLEGAFLFSSHTSNGAVDALLRGIPVVSTGKCITTPLSTPIEKINNPPHPSRAKWAWSLAYQQYHYEEIKSGAFWERFEESWEQHHARSS